MRRRIFLVVIAAVALVALPERAAGDPRQGKQWALAQIGAPVAWASATGSGVRIGIVDSGVDLGHEDVAGQIVDHASCVGSAGDAARCADTGQDLNGHGTHVAGIAAAVDGNGKGIAGVAPAAKLVVARVMSPAGAGTTEDINAGIRWVVDHGARVVNLTPGIPGSSSPACSARTSAPVSSMPGSTAPSPSWPRGTRTRSASGCPGAPTTVTSMRSSSP